MPRPQSHASKTVTTARTLRATTLIALLGALGPQTASAQSNVSDYWAFASTGSSLYGFTNETTRTTISTTLNGGVQLNAANHLATDAAHNRVIYTLTDLGNSQQVTGLYAWDFNTNQRVDLLNGHGNELSSVIGGSYGGGSMYNGSYYLFDDNGTTQGVVKISFDNAGLVSSISKPWGNTTLAGDLGDIAIDANGIMFVYSDASKLYRQDLKDPNSSLTLVGDYSSANTGDQLFIDKQGRLLTGASDSGDWLQLNPNGSNILATITGPSVSSRYTDFSEGGVVGVVPEPQTYALMLLGLASTLSVVRRKRTS